MIQATISYPANAFNEDQWLKLLFLLNDTQGWLDEISSNAFLQVPIADKKKLFRKTYYITVSALAHILERHYYKIPRHPGAGKFTLPLVDILSYLRDAFIVSPTSIEGSLYTERILDAERMVGFDRNSQPTEIITIITDAGGRIMTAFPGQRKNSEPVYK